jgi:hypothetical protein
MAVDYQLPSWQTNPGAPEVNAIRQGQELNLRRKQQAVQQAQLLIEQQQAQRQEAQSQAQAAAAARKYAAQQKYQQDLAALSTKFKIGTPEYQQGAAIAHMNFLGAIGDAGGAGAAADMRALTPPKAATPIPVPAWKPANPQTGEPGRYEMPGHMPLVPRDAPATGASPPPIIKAIPIEGDPDSYGVPNLKTGAISIHKRQPAPDWRKDPTYVWMVKRLESLEKANDNAPSDDLARKALGMRKQIQAFEKAHATAATAQQQAPAETPPAPAAATNAAPVRTATNPQTGERMQLKDGKWIPLQ